MEKQNRFILFNAVILAIFVIILIYISVKYAPEIKQLINDPEQFRLFLLSYGDKSILVFILFHIIQVVIAVIPGDPVQIAGGYIYGTLWGTIYSTLGTLLGSIIALYIVHLLGFSIIRLLVSPKYVQKFDFLIKNKRTEIIMFILYLIPAFPKDFLTYIAGLTSIKPVRFFFITTIARFPEIHITSYIGAHLEQNSYTEVIIASVIVLLVFVISFFLRNKIMIVIRHKSKK